MCVLQFDLARSETARKQRALAFSDASNTTNFRSGPGGAVYSYTAPQANGDGPVTGGGGGGGGGALSADDFSEPTANGTYQSMATGVRFVCTTRLMHHGVVVHA